jgi:hypothetical protein
MGYFIFAVASLFNGFGPAVHHFPGTTRKKISVGLKPFFHRFFPVPSLSFFISDVSSAVPDTLIDIILNLSKCHGR